MDYGLTIEQAVATLSDNDKIIYNAAVEREYIVEEDGITFDKNYISIRHRNLHLSEEQPCELVVGREYIGDELYIAVEVKTRNNVSFDAKDLVDDCVSHSNGTYYFNLIYDEDTYGTKQLRYENLGDRKYEIPKVVYVSVYISDEYYKNMRFDLKLNETRTDYKYVCTSVGEPTKINRTASEILGF